MNDDDEEWEMGIEVGTVRTVRMGPGCSRVGGLTVYVKLNGLVGCTTSGIGGSWDVGSCVCGRLW